MQDLIYLDNNATTSLDPRVLEAMMPFFTKEYGNAASTHHFGQQISKLVEEAREKVADLISADRNEIIFTSGATESINIALKGFALANQHKGKHIITVETEHKAGLDTCKYLESIGFEVTYLPVKRDGLIDLQDFQHHLRSDTILVSVMLVNNEIGVIQPIKEISQLTHVVGAVFMSDATQAVGKIETNVYELGIDVMTFSGHKFYGPKGIGGLYVRGLKSNKIKIETLQHGGSHENGLRSGTLNVPAIIGLGKACEIAKEEMYSNANKIGDLRDELEQQLLRIPNAFVNGSTEKRIYNVCNLCFPLIDANVLIGMLKNIAVSNGSACTSAIFNPSHVLKAIGLSDEDANASIRFSLGINNKQSEIEMTINILSNLLKTTQNSKFE